MVLRIVCEIMRGDYSEVMNSYPSNRTLLPDEMSAPIVMIAYGISATIAYLTAGAYEPLIPETVAAVLLPVPMWLLAYVMIHMATGRRWVVETEK